MGEGRVTIYTDDKIYRGDIQDEKDQKVQELDFHKTQEYDIPGDIYRKLSEKPRITEVAITEQGLEDITKLYKHDTRDIGSLDITRYEKQPLQQKEVEKKTFIQTEEVAKPQKVGPKTQFKHANVSTPSP